MITAESPLWSSTLLLSTSRWPGRDHFLSALKLERTGHVSEIAAHDPIFGFLATIFAAALGQCLGLRALRTSAS